MKRFLIALLTFVFASTFSYAQLDELRVYSSIVAGPSLTNISLAHNSTVTSKVIADRFGFPQISYTTFPKKYTNSLNNQYLTSGLRLKGISFSALINNETWLFEEKVLQVEGGYKYMYKGVVLNQKVHPLSIGVLVSGGLSLNNKLYQDETLVKSKLQASSSVMILGFGIYAEYYLFNIGETFVSVVYSFNQQFTNYDIGYIPIKPFLVSNHHIGIGVNFPTKKYDIIRERK